MIPLVTLYILIGVDQGFKQLLDKKYICQTLTTNNQSRTFIKRHQFTSTGPNHGTFERDYHRMLLLLSNIALVLQLITVYD